MRADRLLSILMLLQTRGQMTAQTLAKETEVSVRTIYRDIDALCMAGVPIYTDRGPGGGVSLLDSYRTTLTGLTRDEVRALFMLTVPAPLADLGLRQELGTALRKLAVALPASFRDDGERVRQRIHLDPQGWSGIQGQVPHLGTIHRAVWDDRLLHLRYQLPFGTEADWLVAPYGLVAKAQAWYLVCDRDGHLRTLRISRVAEARLSKDGFERPADFDLVAFWRLWCADHEANRPHYPVTLRAELALVPILSAVMGRCSEEHSRSDPDGWTTLVVEYESFYEARQRLLGYGGAVEVLMPLALRQSVRDFAERIAERYQEQRPHSSRLLRGNQLDLKQLGPELARHEQPVTLPIIGDAIQDVDRFL